MINPKELVDELIRVDVYVEGDSEYIRVLFKGFGPDGDNVSCGVRQPASDETLKEVAEFSRMNLIEQIQLGHEKYYTSQVLCDRLVRTLRQCLSPVELRDPEITALLEEAEQR